MRSHQKIIAEGLALQAERIAKRYAPAYVVVDEQFEVLHFSSGAGWFIRPAGGAASLKLLDLVHADLRSGVRDALQRAAAQNRTALSKNLHMVENNRRVVVDLIVEPIQSGLRSAPAFAAIFKNVDIPFETQDYSNIQSDHVQRLAAELFDTRERLQATIEELRLSNEEYQSVNEELQRANEELETSKEELESVNSKLETVNAELAHRVQELGRVNSDLRNLLESTQIATVFLDTEARVMNYTPAAEIFHLIEKDIGCSIEHIKSRIVYHELRDGVRRVVRTLGLKERELEVSGGRVRYMARVLPIAAPTTSSPVRWSRLPMSPR